MPKVRPQQSSFMMASEFRVSLRRLQPNLFLPNEGSNFIRKGPHKFRAHIAIPVRLNRTITKTILKHNWFAGEDP